MTKFIKVGLISAFCIIAVSGGVETKSIASSPSVTPQQIISPEKYRELQNSVSSIINEYGEFKRVPSEIALQPFEIAHSEKEINTNTKELILDYGVFLKQ